jgi:peptidyl-prolyl isomerase G (cyclophilin G)
MPPIRTFMDVQCGDIEGRIVFELFHETVPRTCENFRALCTGETSTGSYRGSVFHRIIKGFMIQGGDITKQDGTGGESIYGGKFADENFIHHHSAPGLISMANSGPDTNRSQFFITTAPAPHLDGKHVVFGRVISGKDTILALEKVSVDGKFRPQQLVRITKCGELIPRQPLASEASSAVSVNKTAADEVEIDVEGSNLPSPSANEREKPTRRDDNDNDNDKEEKEGEKEEKEEIYNEHHKKRQRRDKEKEKEKEKRKRVEDRGRDGGRESAQRKHGERRDDHRNRHGKDERRLPSSSSSLSFSAAAVKRVRGFPWPGVHGRGRCKYVPTPQPQEVESAASAADSPNDASKMFSGSLRGMSISSAQLSVPLMQQSRSPAPLRAPLVAAVLGRDAEGHLQVIRLHADDNHTQGIHAHASRSSLLRSRSPSLV